MNSRPRHKSAPVPPLDEAAAIARVRPALRRLNELLGTLDHPRAGEVSRLIESLDTDPPAAWRALDGNDWWAGAGSMAAEAMLEPEQLPPAERQAVVRELRELMIEIAETLRARGAPVNPGLQSWLMAFRSWNASGV